MNRLLITVLLALAFAISLVGLAKGDQQSTSGQATLAQTATGNGTTTQTNGTPAVSAHQRRGQQNSQNGKQTAKKKILQPDPTQKVVQNNKNILQKENASATIVQPQKTTDLNQSFEQTATINGNNVTVTVKALRNNADNSLLVETTETDCSVCHVIEPLANVGPNANISDIQNALKAVADTKVAAIQQTKDPKAPAEKLTLTEKEQDALDKSKLAAEKKIMMCEGTDMVLDGKKYKVTGAKPKKGSAAYVNCLKENYEEALNSDDDDKSDMAPDILDVLTKTYTQALVNQANGKSQKGVMEAFQDFIDAHGEAGDNAGLRMQALGMANAYKSSFAGQDAASIANIKNLIANGDLMGANAALQSLRERANFEAAYPKLTQGAMAARTGAASAFQQYIGTLDSVPDKQVLDAMSSLSSSSATGAGSLQTQVNQLNAQLTQKSQQMTLAQTGQTGMTGTANDNNIAQASRVAAQKLVNDALGFLGRNGEYPRDFSQYGDGEASAVNSWVEGAYRQNLGSTSGRIGPVNPSMQTALQTQNGTINALLQPQPQYQQYQQYQQSQPYLPQSQQAQPQYFMSRSTGRG